MQKVSVIYVLTAYYLLSNKNIIYLSLLLTLLMASSMTGATVVVWVGGVISFSDLSSSTSSITASFMTLFNSFILISLTDLTSTESLSLTGLCLSKYSFCMVLMLSMSASCSAGGPACRFSSLSLGAGFLT